MTHCSKPLRSHLDPVGGYTEISHTADLALRVWGEDLGTLFAAAAVGMTSFMGVASPGEELDRWTRRVSLTAIDVESLLVEWLSELAFFAESEGELFHGFSIEEISETRLTATLTGERSQKPKRVIKAVTYHNLQLIRSDRGFETTVTFDV